MATYVVCVDGSDHSNSAVEVAKACSHQSDSVILLAVVSKQAIGNLEYMERAASSLKDRKVSTQILSSSISDPSYTILSECDGRCDVIVTGTRGRGMLAQKLLGSVSARLVNNVRESAVLVVPNRAFHTGATVHCICMNDGSVHAMRCVKLLARLLQERDSVCFLTCLSKDAQNTTAPQTEGRDVYQQYGGKARISCHSVYSSDPAAAVTDLLSTSQEPVNFIAVGCRGLNPVQSMVLGSTTRSLIASGTYPILICRAPRQSEIQSQTDATSA